MWSLAKSWDVNLTNSLNCLPGWTLSQQSEDDLNLEEKLLLLKTQNSVNILRSIQNSYSYDPFQVTAAI